MRAVIYARYSTELQRDASIDDQIRICKAEIKKRGFELVQTYADHAISGTTQLRPGYQKLLNDARTGAFDIVFAEALDRLSRDQESIAGLFKRMTFANVKLITISEGEISELHVGLKGTMNALFLKDLALKTHRGLEGRVRQGKSAGGRSFGYSVVRQFGPDGQPIAGLRKINQPEAAIVRRIFKMFAGSTSPRTIAKTLNDEEIPGPDGRRWSETTIRGHSARRTGILRNDLYHGKLVWNKQRYVKDPKTGNRLARANPADAWIWKNVPDLQIVPDDLWSKVASRLDGITNSTRVQKAVATKFWEKRRPKHLLTGMVTCARCGGPMASIGQDYIACSAARRTGTCKNAASVRRSHLENAVLGVLKDNLLQPDLVEEFVRSYHAEINRNAAEASAQSDRSTKKLTKIEKQIEAIIDSIANGFRSDALKERLEQLESERKVLGRDLSQTKPFPIRLHPKLPAIYRAKVEKLTEALTDPAIRDEATEAIRGLIDAVTVEMTEAGPEVEVRGEISKMIGFSDPKIEQNQCSVKVVAGRCNCLHLLIKATNIAQRALTRCKRGTIQRHGS